jgi:tRNA U34 5-carboxymethylaminomethyl modifying enzyme MnmG/GidA
VKQKDKAMQDYDVIVIGGGHAGTEAAAASARIVRSSLCDIENDESTRKKKTRTIKKFKISEPY